MDWQAAAALYIGAMVSGLLPLVNAELLVMGVAATATGYALPLITAASTAGQMTSKLLLFSIARWAPQRLPVRARTTLERGSAALQRRGGAGGALIFVSAITGLPPFYAMSLAAGALRVPVLTFLAAGLAGRAIHFAGIAWFAGGLANTLTFCARALLPGGGATC